MTKNNYKILAGLVVLAVIIAGGWHIFTTPKPEAPQAPGVTNPFTAIVGTLISVGQDSLMLQLQHNAGTLTVHFTTLTAFSDPITDSSAVPPGSMVGVVGTMGQGGVLNAQEVMVLSTTTPAKPQ
jgi:hypothetical protein